MCTLGRERKVRRLGLDEEDSQAWAGLGWVWSGWCELSRGIGRRWERGSETQRQMTMDDPPGWLVWTVKPRVPDAWRVPVIDKSDPVGTEQA